MSGTVRERTASKVNGSGTANRTTSKGKITDDARNRGTKDNGGTRRVSMRDKGFGNKTITLQKVKLVTSGTRGSKTDSGIDESNWVEVDLVGKLRNEVGEPISYGSEYDWEYLSVWSDICK